MAANFIILYFFFGFFWFFRFFFVWFCIGFWIFFWICSFWFLVFGYVDKKMELFREKYLQTKVVVEERDVVFFCFFLFFGKQPHNN